MNNYYNEDCFKVSIFHNTIMNEIIIYTQSGQAYICKHNPVYKSVCMFQDLLMQANNVKITLPWFVMKQKETSLNLSRFLRRQSKS